VLAIKNTPHTPSSKVRAHEGIVDITYLASIPSSRNSAPTRMLNVASRQGQKLAMNLAIELDRKQPQAQAALENAGEILLSLQ
jgi:hypothetical protein